MSKLWEAIVLLGVRYTSLFNQKEFAIVPVVPTDPAAPTLVNGIARMTNPEVPHQPTPSTNAEPSRPPVPPSTRRIFSARLLHVPPPLSPPPIPTIYVPSAATRLLPPLIPTICVPPDAIHLQPVSHPYNLRTHSAACPSSLQSTYPSCHPSSTCPPAPALQSTYNPAATPLPLVHISISYIPRLPPVCHLSPSLQSTYPGCRLSPIPTIYAP